MDIVPWVGHNYRITTYDRTRYTDILLLQLVVLVCVVTYAAVTSSSTLITKKTHDIKISQCDSKVLIKSHLCKYQILASLSSCIIAGMQWTFYEVFMRFLL